MLSQIFVFSQCSHLCVRENWYGVMWILGSCGFNIYFYEYSELLVLFGSRDLVYSVPPHCGWTQLTIVRQTIKANKSSPYGEQREWIREVFVWWFQFISIKTLYFSIYTCTCNLLYYVFGCLKKWFCWHLLVNVLQTCSKPHRLVDSLFRCEEDESNRVCTCKYDSPGRLQSWWRGIPGTALRTIFCVPPSSHNQCPCKYKHT